MLAVIGGMDGSGPAGRGLGEPRGAQRGRPRGLRWHAGRSPSGARWWWRCFSPRPPLPPWRDDDAGLGIFGASAAGSGAWVARSGAPSVGDGVRCDGHGAGLGHWILALAAKSNVLWAGGGAHGGGALALDSGRRWPTASVAGAGVDGGGFGVRRCCVRDRVCSISMRGPVRGGGGRTSYAAAVRSRRTDAPLDGLLRDVWTTTAMAASLGSDILARRLCWEHLGRKPRRRWHPWVSFSLLRASYPPSTSSTGENPVQSGTSGDGAIGIVPFLKASLLEFVPATMPLLVDTLRFSAPSRREEVGLAA